MCHLEKIFKLKGYENTISNVTEQIQISTYGNSQMLTTKKSKQLLQRLIKYVRNILFES